MSPVAADRPAGGDADRALRIIHCFRAPVGGLFRHVSDLARAQAARGHAVGVVCDSSTGGAFEEELLEGLRPHLSLGLKRIPMRRQIAPSDLAATWRLFREVSGLKPDVLHAHGAKAGVYARVIGTLLRVRRRRVARIYTPHGGSLHYEAGSRSGRVYFTAERILQRMTDALVFVSAFEGNTYRDKVGPPRVPVTLARNGLRPEEFETILPAADAVDFLFIGALRDLKGPDVFVEALAAIAGKRGGPATALIVGDGPDKLRYEGMVHDLGLGPTTRFAGSMPAREAFAMARALVVPSRAESMPYIVLEAIGAGLPMIATNVGGIPEIYGPFSAGLVPPGDAAALADAMLALAENPAKAQETARALRTHIEPSFSVTAMADTIEQAYRKASR